MELSFSPAWGCRELGKGVQATFLLLMCPLGRNNTSGGRSHCVGWLILARNSYPQGLGRLCSAQTRGLCGVPE